MGRTREQTVTRGKGGGGVQYERIHFRTHSIGKYYREMVLTRAEEPMRGSVEGVRGTEESDESPREACPGADGGSYESRTVAGRYSDGDGQHWH